MAKANRGGKRNTPPPTQPNNQTPPLVFTNAGTPIQFSQNIQQAVDDMVEDGTIDGAGGGNISFDEFMKMSMDERVAVMQTAMSEDTPDFLDDSAFQRITYAMGVDRPPTLVDDATLDTTHGSDLFRTVNSLYDRQNDVNYTASEIAQQIQLGDYTRCSGVGGSAYGKGLYFADNFYDSRMYGRGNGASGTMMVRAKYAPNAKVMNYRTAYSGVSKEISSGSNLGKLLRQMDTDSQTSAYALAKGYQAVQDSGGYNVILDRSCLLMSKTYKNPMKLSQW